MSAEEGRIPGLGFGLGLRREHYRAVLEQHPPLEWLEALTENYLVPGGKPIRYLERIRALYPMVLHGVSLNIGSTDPLSTDYLLQVKDLARRIEPAWISDHLCWTGVRGVNAHDLLPLPYTEEAVRHVASRVARVQDVLERPLLLENVSSYVELVASSMTEWEFLSAVAEESDCLILLDINNIHVSARNHGFDPLAYLDGVPRRRAQQFHLAGHSDYGNHIIDTHDAPVVDAVWDLYAQAVRRFGRVSCLIERDDAIPPLEVLLQELARARAIAAAVDGSTDV